ncbi:hypothetical protein AOC36_09580 [Erysipelothrix larvae]|uniref:Terminase n=1 Tax=Erysipelothrix larvae TaxID=1514105 RepID=A0A0X8H192_9FIRM|nr:hypothetical protein [Erysipelothrix larvae]AMC94223.1 hypothetical protein AOC36_09580 [Erysipelothrix larvae]
MREINKKTGEPFTLDELVTRAKRKIKSSYKAMNPEKKKIAEGLIENGAFLYVHLYELQEAINDEGTTIEYQNGKNQFGTKQNPDISTYNAFLKQYKEIIKQLTDLLPENEDISDNDELRAFLKKGKPR